MPDKIDLLQGAKTAFEYGPFYFALVLLLTVSTFTGRAYRKVCARSNPPSSGQERATHRQVFVATTAVGLLLVVVSVIWWIAARPKLYVFTAMIRGLNDYVSVSSGRNVYFQPEPTAKYDDEGALLRNEHLVAIQQAPFKAGQKIRVEFAKGQKASGTYEIEYTAEEKEPEFRWSYNVQSGKNELERIRSASGFEFPIGRAYADDAERRSPEVPTAERAAGSVRSAGSRGSQPRTSGCKQFDPLLQQQLGVGTRIAAVEGLLAMSDDEARQCVFAREGSAALPALLELSRHSDLELASKTSALLKKLRWEDHVVRELNSEAADRRRAAEELVTGLPPADAQELLRRAGLLSTARGRKVIGLVGQRAGDQPIPTGTRRGDRFYVKATWDATQQPVVECLTALFNRELMSQRSIDDERRLMEGRASRVVYWYDADWAVHIHKAIRGCGGKAEYVAY